MALDARQIDEQNTLRRARLLNMAYVDTSQIADKPLFHELLSVPELYETKVVPLSLQGIELTFGVTTTTSQQTMQRLRERFADQRTTFALISDSGYREYMKLYDPPKTVEYQDIAINTPSGVDVNGISETLKQVRAEDMLAYLVQQAFRLKASDIHLETKNGGAARLRLRVDGVLHPIAELSPETYRQLISALASAANISVSADSDQTGHINRSYQLATGESVTVNVRVETVPAINGIDAVLRLFNFRADMLQLDKLGLTSDQQAMVMDVVHRPSGLVLVVGPTGSGKSTTLYSILHELNNSERKIITLEDPVEYQIDGISQIPVKSRDGQSFADKFRAVMRLDPDVIMVGEIRDTDTARTALQAALTGHLVLSTYHAGSAAAALTRLLDAIGENPLYISAIRLVMAQRLVRRLDSATRQTYQPDDHTSDMIQKIVAALPPGTAPALSQPLTLYKPGSSAELPFGYSGQFAIREFLTITPAMQQLLMQPAREISSDAIEKVATDQGMITMLEDGVLHALNGDTSIEEIFRVVD